MPDHTPHSTSIDVVLQGGETMTIGNARFQILDTLGHTTGSTCYLMERAGQRVLFSGVVIFRLEEKPLGTCSTYLAPRYRGDAKDYLVSLRKLQALPVSQLLLPGHPSASRGPQSPSLTHAKWQQMLESGIQEMERLIDRFEADGANFLDGHPKQLLGELYYFGDFQGTCVYGFFAASRFFLIDAPGGPKLHEFLQTQLKKLGLQPTEPFAVLLTACGEQETAGLPGLVERSNIQVVASADGLDVVRQLCPASTTISSASDLPNQGWFKVMPLPLSGRGIAPVAYVLRWTHKTILFSGRIPLVFDQQSRSELAAQLIHSRQPGRDYLTSIGKLLKVQPDVWLPSVSTDAQNANLYEGAWKTILQKNYRAASEFLSAA